VSFRDLDALAKAVADRLFFASEVTSLRHRGTVHGSWGSRPRTGSTRSFAELADSSALDRVGATSRDDAEGAG
jgi:hypothetical protein